MHDPHGRDEEGQGRDPGVGKGGQSEEGGVWGEVVIKRGAMVV